MKTRISSTLLIRLRFTGYRSKSGIVRTLNCVYSTFKNDIFRLEQIFNKLMIDSEEGKVIDKFSLLKHIFHFFFQVGGSIIIQGMSKKSVICGDWCKNSNGPKENPRTFFSLKIKSSEKQKEKLFKFSSYFLLIIFSKVLNISCSVETFEPLKNNFSAKIIPELKIENFLKTNWQIF